MRKVCQPMKPQINLMIGLLCLGACAALVLWLSVG